MDLFQKELQKTGEFGEVVELQYPLVVVKGLPNARSHEIVIFETGEFGEVFTLNKDTVEILLFSRNPSKVGTKVTRTQKPLSISISDNILGSVISPLGETISKGLQKTPSQIINKEIDTRPLGISKRARINKPFETGTVVVDMMIPLGRGQKELIVGDRKTGKSSFLFTAIKSQIEKGAIVVYGAIGRQKTVLKDLQDLYKSHGLLDKMVIVATSSYDSPSLVYLAPYTAMTIAEYYRDKGIDTVVVLDDLSTHAKFYREISLIAKNFPGRDSYPGDIFYIHARLLERAGNFKHKEKGEVSITCLPVAETVEGDITGYITTNIMSMTDGHIFFDSGAYHRGRRPAINIPLSVTRVGRQTQSKVKRDITRELTSFLTLYDKIQTLSHFGAELTDTVKNTLANGEKIYRFFDQPYALIVPENISLVLFSMIWIKMLSEEQEKDIERIRVTMMENAKNPDVNNFLNEIINVNSFNELLGKVNQNKERLLSLIQQPPSLSALEQQNKMGITQNSSTKFGE